MRFFLIHYSLFHYSLLTFFVKVSLMEIQFLADRPDIIPAIACLHQLEMKLGAKSNYQRTIEKFSYRLNRTKLPLAFVAFADTLPVGSISLVDLDLPSYSHLTPWLGSLFVATPDQKQGIGYQLIQQIEQIAAKMGAQHLYLFTWTSEAYYHKQGWTVIDKTVPQGLPESVVMQKTL